MRPLSSPVFPRLQHTENLPLCPSEILLALPFAGLAWLLWRLALRLPSGQEQGNAHACLSPKGDGPSGLLLPAGSTDSLALGQGRQHHACAAEKAGGTTEVRGAAADHAKLLTWTPRGCSRTSLQFLHFGMISGGLLCCAPKALCLMLSRRQGDS